MAEWLKAFGLGFFSDRLAARSSKFGFVSVVIAIVLSFVFFMFGFMAADTVPFSAHYDGASDFKGFLHGALASGLDVEIKGGTASCDRVVNTYTVDADKKMYAAGGYELIIDTRPSDTLIEFTQVGVDGDTEIDYETYLGLSAKDKKRCGIETRYTANELVLTEAATDGFEKYLESITAEGADGYNAEAAAAYEKLRQSGLAASEYGRQVYYLYVKYYYTNIESSLMSAKAPVLCDYYYLNYILKNNGNYICLLDDICAGAFKTDGGIPAMFAGYYKGCADGKLTEKNVDGFVKDVYYSSVEYSMSSYFTGAMQMAPAYILIPLVVAAALFFAAKATKKRFASKFLTCRQLSCRKQVKKSFRI